MNVDGDKKTAYMLINEICKLGFTVEDAVRGVDDSLDEIIGFTKRKPLSEEVLSDKLYSSILKGFKKEAEYRNGKMW